jgi:hypothetical protein
MHESGQAMQRVKQAAGQGEFYADGTCVNTLDGWREMRLGVFAKRPAGVAVAPEQWRRRVLPAPRARAAFCAIADSESFAGPWARLAEQAGWPAGRGLRAYADGAKWIWRQVAEKFPYCECVVDLFHVSEHIHACARALYGEGTPEARRWAEEQVEALIRTNPVAVIKRLRQQHEEASSESARQALAALLRYLTANLDGLWYGERLRRGEPIGSGLVEGVCKTIIGQRLKANSARWRAKNADAVGSLACLLYDDRWEAFWNAEAA